MKPSVIYHYKHIKRYREILHVLTKHGFGYLLETLHVNINSIPFRRKAEITEPAAATAERLRMVLEELGPTFIKLGQLLSTRPELLPPAYIHQLEQLQDKVTPEPFQAIQATIEQELGKPLAIIFKEFDPVPIATASIGQVHHGILTDGKAVAVKVQRAHIAEKIQADLDILIDVAHFLESRFSWARQYRLIGLAEEFADTIRDELDYTAEAANAARLKENLGDFHHILIPEIYKQYSTRKVLVMEYLSGQKLGTESVWENISPKAIARELMAAFLKQIMEDGFFHADLHPGNIQITSDGHIVLMDFGMMGRIDEVFREQLLLLFIKGYSKDSDGVANLIIRLGTSDTPVDKAALRRDVYTLLDKYYSRTLDQIRIGPVFQEIIKIAVKHHIHIPREMVMVSRSSLLLESLVERLDPTLDWVTALQPLIRKLIQHRFDPSRLMKKAKDYTVNTATSLAEIPDMLQQVLRRIEEGKVQLTIEHLYFEEFMQKTGRLGNRLSFSLIIASIIIGTSLIAQKSADSFLWRLPISELGFIIAVMMGLWLIISIIRSGKL